MSVVFKKLFDILISSVLINPQPMRAKKKTEKNTIPLPTWLRFCKSIVQSTSTIWLQSRTKLLEKVFPIMSTFLRNKTISKTTPLRKENPFPQFNVASHKCPGTRLFFLIHNNIAFRGRGRRKNRYSFDVQKNAVQVYNFRNSFVQDCSLQSMHNCFATRSMIFFGIMLSRQHGH